MSLISVVRRASIPLLVLLLSAPAAAQPVAADSRPPPAPVPIAGGDVVSAPGLSYQIHQWLPGSGPGLDGVNSELNGITNFNGLAAMAYTSGVATDSTGVMSVANTDIRLYQGEYVGQDGRHAHGTFVEI